MEKQRTLIKSIQTSKKFVLSRLAASLALGLLIQSQPAFADYTYSNIPSISRSGSGSIPSSNSWKKSWQKWENSATPKPYQGSSYPTQQNNYKQGYGYAGYPGYAGSTNYANNNYAGNYSSNSVSYFNEAMRAADRMDINALYRYEQQMQGSLFAMYPSYWRIDSNIVQQPASNVIAFAKRYPDTVMAEKLVADYAEAKAKQGDYLSVRQVARLVKNADDSERCAISLAKIQKGGSQIVKAEKPKVWLTTLKQPALCDLLANAMIHHSAISQSDRQARLARMLREGKTGDIIALSHKLGTPIAYEQLSRIQLYPNGFFNQFAQQRFSQTNQALYLYALAKVAKRSYREAYTQLAYDIRQDNQRHNRLLSDSTRRYAYRTIAVQRMNHNTDDGFNSEAVTWFRHSFGEPFNFEEAEDYAQAAIRYSQWQDLINAIASMDRDTQKEPIWQYWLARAYEKSKDSKKRKQAKAAYKRLARTNDYYGFLAKDRIGQAVSLHALGGRSMPTISTSEMARMHQNPHFSRAFALHNSGVSPKYAKREWNWAVKQARDKKDSKLILAAAKYAHDIGWLDRAVYAIDKGQVSAAALSHPMPYKNSVVRYSRNAGINPAWAYGIMRQESRFISSARSGVGASGLMQIMPATAKFIARNLGEPYNARRVNTGDTNVRYGTWYMGHVLGELNYQPTVATAAYNAGPSKAKRWLPDYGQLSADQYVETIPYPETRNYVKRVMENATIYGALLGQSMPISQRMGTIRPGYG